MLRMACPGPCTPHALPHAPERLPSRRHPRGLPDVLTLPSHPALLREQMKGEVSSLPCSDNLQPLLQRCQSFKASSWQHENRHKHEAQPQAPTAIPPGEKGMTTGGSWSPKGQGLMGSRTQRSGGQRETQGQTSNNTGPHWQRKPFAFSADPSRFLQKWGLAASSSYIFNSSHTAKTPGR